MVSLAEQETVIQYGREDDHATIYTSDSTRMTKLDRLCKESPEFYSLKEVAKDQDGHIVSKTYTLSDKKMVSFRGKKMSRVMTEEQKAAAAERLARYRSNSEADVEEE